MFLYCLWLSVVGFGTYTLRTSPHVHGYFLKTLFLLWFKKKILSTQPAFKKNLFPHEKADADLANQKPEVITRKGRTTMASAGGESNVWRGVTLQCHM